ncbi:MAG: entericidin A/B family lipoprotein [Sphingobium sp.]
MKLLGTKRVVMMAAMGLAVVALAGCATVKGLGRDISSAGQAGEDAINGR